MSWRYALIITSFRINRRFTVYVWVRLLPESAEAIFLPGRHEPEGHGIAPICLHMPGALGGLDFPRIGDTVY